MYLQICWPQNEKDLSSNFLNNNNNNNPRMKLDIFRPFARSGAPSIQKSKSLASPSSVNSKHQPPSSRRNGKRREKQLSCETQSTVKSHGDLHDFWNTAVSSSDEDDDDDEEDTTHNTIEFIPHEARVVADGPVARMTWRRKQDPPRPQIMFTKSMEMQDSAGDEDEIEVVPAGRSLWQNTLLARAG